MLNEYCNMSISPIWGEDSLRHFSPWDSCWQYLANFKTSFNVGSSCGSRRAGGPNKSSQGIANSNWLKIRLNTSYYSMQNRNWTEGNFLWQLLSVDNRFAVIIGPTQTRKLFIGCYIFWLSSAAVASHEARNTFTTDDLLEFTMSSLDGYQYFQE